MKKQGFTIVELLIVVVIIAILAVITVVAFNGLQNRARASQASAALAGAKKKLELYKVDNSAYPATGNLASAGITDGPTTYQYTSDAASYCLTATVANISYYLNSTTVANPTQGGCAGHGQGGVAAVTNLVTSPAATGGDWAKVVNTGAGAGSFEASGGPSGVSATFFRLTITTPPTSAVPYLTYAGTVGGRIQPTAGQPFSASVWVRSNRPASMRFLFVASSIGGSEWNSVMAGPATTLSLNTWTRITAQVASWPAGAAYAATRILMETRNTVPGFWIAGDTVDATGLMATITPSPPAYADGNSANWVWNGTPNASTSTGPTL